jgi:hypothetical protein
MSTPTSCRRVTLGGNTMTLEERDALFADLLMLVLPPEVNHRSFGENVVPSIIDAARRGAYRTCGDTRWPYFFTAAEYCKHLLPAVDAAWHAAYMDRAHSAAPTTGETLTPR